MAIILISSDDWCIPSRSRAINAWVNKVIQLFRHKHEKLTDRALTGTAAIARPVKQKSATCGATIILLVTVLLEPSICDTQSKSNPMTSHASLDSLGEEVKD